MCNNRTTFSRMKLLGSAFPSAMIRVDVDDDNDNSPTFDRHVYHGYVRLNVSKPYGFSDALNSAIASRVRILVSWRSI